MEAFTAVEFRSIVRDCEAGPAPARSLCPSGDVGCLTLAANAVLVFALGAREWDIRSPALIP